MNRLNLLKQQVHKVLFILKLPIQSPKNLKQDYTSLG